MKSVSEFLAQVSDELKVVPDWAKPRCSECDDTQWISRDGKASRCRACRPSITKRLEILGVPSGDANVDLENIPPEIHKLSPRVTAVAEALLRYVANGHKESVLLVGNPGTGKSSLAAGVLRARMKSGSDGDRYCHLPTWFRLLKDSYSDGPLSEASLFQPLLSAGFLVLDELGTKQGATDWAVEQLLQVVHYRLTNNVSTLVTTNLSVAEIRETFGDRLSSRFSSYVVIPVNGPDLRVKA